MTYIEAMRQYYSGQRYVVLDGAHGQHTYRITPGISMLSPHLFRRRHPSTESEFQPQTS